MSRQRYYAGLAGLGAFTGLMFLIARAINQGS